ncbi:hypothetical protein GE09DRAFT_168713 [Coniochaeta sp. 2T2.1]|nr:hypothetical protein GE09DRAFT_168713 [Coniochaeta sp. 2T2.1]
MSSFFSTRTTFVHESPFPKGTTTDAAIAMLHDHPYFFECNPHTAKFELLKPETKPDVPDPVKPLVVKETECYQATDIVHALPAGLWDSNVVSTYEFTDTGKGVFVRIRSPLNVVMETVWEVKEEGDQLELVENVSFTCSRLLAPVVRSQCEGGWRKIHGKMISRFES